MKGLNCECRAKLPNILCSCKEFRCFAQDCRIWFAMSSKCQLKVVPRKPIPNWIDSITKKWKYVDPGHRYCVPGFKAASFTPKNKAEKYNGRTHNCYAAVTTNNGDRYSVSTYTYQLCVLRRSSVYYTSTIFVTFRAALPSAFHIFNDTGRS